MIVSTGSGRTCQGHQGLRFHDKTQRGAVELRKMEDVVTPADVQQLRDQLRQELSQRATTNTLTAAVAQSRAEMMNATNSRTDQLSRLSSAELNVV